MQRIAHGSTSTPKKESAEGVLAELGEAIETLTFLAPSAPPASTPFTYLFSELSDDDAYLIPQTDKTLEHLSELGDSMRDEEDNTDFNSSIPAAYTYFAQFLNHDIAHTEVEKDKGVTDSMLLDDPCLAPWPKNKICAKVKNKRVSFIDLDCVYGLMAGGLPPPRDKENTDKMGVGTVTESGSRPYDKDDYNDLVRLEMSKADPRSDRTALIADRRNDSNLILSQLHVAFLRAHNAIVEREKCNFADARQILRMHYHWLVIKDFLEKIVPEATIEEVKANPHYSAAKGLPFEFSVGAYRFGHSMIRRLYYLNDNYQRETLGRLFTLTVLSNGLGPTPGEGCKTLPEKRIIQWRKFLDGGKNAARVLRPQMVEPLFDILDETDMPVKGEKRLAVQDLKRGYLMRIPTGQAIADRLGLIPLKADIIEKFAVNAKQSQVLKKSGFSSKTPLWFYVLAEAAHAQNEKLGPVGGRLVAEVLVGLIRNIPYSFLNQKWEPALGATKGKFFLSDLLRLAGVLEKK